MRALALTLLVTATLSGCDDGGDNYSPPVRPPVSNSTAPVLDCEETPNAKPCAIERENELRPPVPE